MTSTQSKQVLLIPESLIPVIHVKPNRPQKYEAAPVAAAVTRRRGLPSLRVSRAEPLGCWQFGRPP